LSKVKRAIAQSGKTANWIDCMTIDFNWVVLFLRGTLATVMVYYGLPKIRDPAANANNFVQMGFRPGIFWGTVIAAVEFFGGIAVLLGCYAELAAALFAFQMLVGTFWKLKINKPFSDYSYDIQLFAICLVIMAQGAGAYAIRSLPGLVFLRWDVARFALAAALLLAALSKPGLNHSQPATDNSDPSARSAAT
jgi:putative oxidoreductase